MRATRSFYDRAKPRIHRRIATELRCARRILDIGCGGCDLDELLARVPGREVIGVDIAGSAFPTEGRKERHPRCIKADARALDFIESASVDAVVSVWALHEISAPMAVLREAWRVLRPCGEIVIVDFPRGSIAQRLWHERYYTTAHVATMLKRAGFVGVEARRAAQKQLTWARGFRPPPPEAAGTP